MRYGLHTRIRKGRRISLFVTMKCPLQCSYCSLRAGCYQLPFPVSEQTNELSVDEWKPLLINLFRFMPIREIYVTGGEPTVRDDISELINFLLLQDKCVTLHSNLWTDSAMEVKRTNRFRILSTFHRSDSVSQYSEMLNLYAGKYRVDITEIETDCITGSAMKSFEVPGEGLAGQKERFAIAPDGHIFVRMGMFYKHLGGKI